MRRKNTIFFGGGGGGGGGRGNILNCLCTHLSVAISSRKSDINNFTLFRIKPINPQKWY